jgi:hypothetical protein
MTLKNWRTDSIHCKQKFLIASCKTLLNGQLPSWTRGFFSSKHLYWDVKSESPEIEKKEEGKEATTRPWCFWVLWTHQMEGKWLRKQSAKKKWWIRALMLWTRHWHTYWLQSFKNVLACNFVAREQNAPSRVSPQPERLLGKRGARRGWIPGVKP